MRIDGSNPAPAPQPAAHENKPHPAPPAPALANDQLEQHHPDLGATNVVVEMQKGNVLVYKFIDDAGRLVQQIPSAGMLKISEAIAESQKPKDTK